MSLITSMNLFQEAKYLCYTSISSAWIDSDEFYQMIISIDFQTNGRSENVSQTTHIFAYKNEQILCNSHHNSRKLWIWLENIYLFKIKFLDYFSKITFFYKNLTKIIWGQVHYYNITKHQLCIQHQFYVFHSNSSYSTSFYVQKNWVCNITINKPSYLLGW